MYRIVYFKDTKILNNLTICQNALRIPEIFLRIRQVSEQLEQMKISTNLKNLFHLLDIDESSFESSFKSWDIDFWHIVMTIIQVGLYDRYLKSQAPPLAFVASSNAYAAKISGRLRTIKDMITDLSNKHKSTPFDFQNKIARNNLSFFMHNEKTKKYNCLVSDMHEPEELFLYIEKYQISQIVVIGPSNLVHLSQNNMPQHQIPSETDWLLHEITKSKVLSDKICIIESIDLDPLLFWFWRDCSKSFLRPFLKK